MQRSVEAKGEAIVKVNMVRSKKPEVKKEVEDMDKRLTQDEVDYIRYVEGSKQSVAQ